MTIAQQYSKKFRQEFYTLVLERRPFSCADIRAAVGNPPQGVSPNVIGALYQACVKQAQADQLIKPVVYKGI